jgi:hypothetical protein
MIYSTADRPDQVVAAQEAVRAEATHPAKALPTTIHPSVPSVRGSHDQSVLTGRIERVGAAFSLQFRPQGTA